MDPTQRPACCTPEPTIACVRGLILGPMTCLCVVACAVGCGDEPIAGADVPEYWLPVGADLPLLPDGVSGLADVWDPAVELGPWRPLEGDAQALDGTSGDWESTEGFEPWSLVVLPDTQYYSERFPHVFEAQTAWIAANARDWNIRFVAHVGDVTNRNTPEEYWVAVKACKHLRDAGIPFALVPGNHDYQGNGGKRESYLSVFFSPADYGASARSGTFEPGNVENSWHLFDAGGQSWLVLALEFGPRKKVVDWALAVAARYSDANAIVLTHAFLYEDDTRYDWAKKGDSQYWNPHTYPIADLPGGVLDGQELWETLVARIPGARYVLSGHVLGDGVGRLSSVGPSGNVVHQMLANYQTGCSSDLPEGGAGYLRILLHTSPHEVQVLTFSPYLDKYLVDGQNEFLLTFEPKDYL